MVDMCFWQHEVSKFCEGDNVVLVLSVHETKIFNCWYEKARKVRKVALKKIC